MLLSEKKKLLSEGEKANTEGFTEDMTLDQLLERDCLGITKKK